MATSATKFECYIPVASTGSQEDTAIQQFIQNIQSLAQCVMDTCYLSTPSGQLYSYRIYGFLLPTQTSTALGYLNTLNNALGSNILAVSSAGTLQP